MAFPTVVNTATTTEAASSSIPITMPASIVAGRLLLAFLFSSGIDGSTGWTQVGSLFQTSNSWWHQVLAQIATGSDTLTQNTGFAFTAAITYQIDNWSGSISDIKFASADGTLDPPSLAMGANADNLWIAAGFEYFGATFTAPTNYSGLVTVSRSATATRALTAGTEDPGVFGGTTTQPIALTVGVAPAAGGAAPGPPPPPMNRARLIRASCW